MKSESEKFAGALRTYSIEALMGDGRALQAGTSHNLGQNFAKAFDITFQARDKSVQHVWGTSWGMTTRLIGAAIMVHGDDSGPRAAAAHRAVSGGHRADRPRQLARDSAAEGAGDPARARWPPASASRSTSATSVPAGSSPNGSLRGVPLRLEIGPKDIEKSAVLVARRDTREKQSMPMDGLAARASRAARRRSRRTLFDACRAVPRRAHAARGRPTTRSSRRMEGRPGFIIAPWCGAADCEAQIKNDTQATIRNMPLNASDAVRDMHSLRPAGDRGGVVRESVLIPAGEAG